MKKKLLLLPLFFLFLQSTYSISLVYGKEIINNKHKSQKEMKLEELYINHLKTLEKIGNDKKILVEIWSQKDYLIFREKYKDSNDFEREFYTYNRRIERVEEEFWYQPLTEEKLDEFILIDEDFNFINLDI